MLMSSYDFQILQTLFQAFRNRSNGTVYILCHRHFHVPQLFRLLASSMYFYIFFVSFSFLLSGRMPKSTGWRVLFFLLIITMSGPLAKIVWFACISEYQWVVCVTFCRTVSGLYINHFSAYSNYNLLTNSLSANFPNGRPWVQSPICRCHTKYFINGTWYLVA